MLGSGGIAFVSTGASPPPPCTSALGSLGSRGTTLKDDEVEAEPATAAAELVLAQLGLCPGLHGRE